MNATIEVGTVAVRCPECADELPVVVRAELTWQDGQQFLVCDPDMTDLWAHKFTHEGSAGRGEANQ